MKRDKEVITLGSGELFIMAYEKGSEIPENAVIETDANRAGWISGGASLEYTPEWYEAKDDLGMVSKTILTNEEAVLKSGIMTWNGDTLKQLTSTAVVTETATVRTVKIGGMDNFKNTIYLIRFVHKDSVDGDVRITLAGQNQAGFALTFSKDEATVIDAEFKALPSTDNEGTLVIYEETIGEAEAGRMMTPDSAPVAEPEVAETPEKAKK